jgi:hypothetical protein
MVLPTLMMPGHGWSLSEIVATPNVRLSLVLNVYMLGVFYWNYSSWLPRFYFEQKYWTYIAYLLAAFSVIILLIVLFDQPPHLSHGPHVGPSGIVMRHPRPFLPLFPVLVNFLLFSTGILVGLFLKSKTLLETARQEKLNAELSYLKSQINPHFLFNTLNVIYAQALQEEAEQTASSMLKLSGMMRYVVTEASNDYVSLEREIAYINDYIQLQRYRLAPNVRLEYIAPSQVPALQIAPIILVPFIENAFKYGVNPEENSDIYISISVEDSVLKLVVRNNMVSVRHFEEHYSNQGISNTRNRLSLLYPGLHELNIKQSEQQFIVELTINLGDK